MNRITQAAKDAIDSYEPESCLPILADKFQSEDSPGIEVNYLANWLHAYETCSSFDEYLELVTTSVREWIKYEMQDEYTDSQIEQAITWAGSNPLKIKRWKDLECTTD